MAIGKNLLLKGMSGSLGNFTVVPLADGHVILKEKISSMTNPRTLKQMVQRFKMKNAVSVIRYNIDMIRKMSIKREGRKSAVNQMTSHLLKNVVSIQNGNAVWDYKKFCPSLAVTPSSYKLVVSNAATDAATKEHSLNVAVTIPPGATGISANDQMFVVFLFKKDKKMVVSRLGAIGSSLSAAVKCLPGRKDDARAYFHTYNPVTKERRGFSAGVEFKSTGTHVIDELSVLRPPTDPGEDWSPSNA